nr:zinc finger, CCHC-type [Tanacetum cinerariifolium]
MVNRLLQVVSELQSKIFWKLGLIVKVPVVQMRALLIQHGCEAALEIQPVDMEAQTKSELNKKAHSAVVLYLDSCQSTRKPRLKSRTERLKRYIFQSEDHLKRICQKNNCKKSTCYVKKDDQPSFSGSTYDDSEVMMVMSAKALLDWIMDSGCSYHMTPRYWQGEGITESDIC